jgi:signal transduction histidine kinase
MRFETRALIVLTLALVLGLSMINFLSVAYLRLVLEDSLEREIDKVYRLYVLGSQTAIPDHIKVSGDPLPPEGFQVVRYTGKHFIFVREGYIQERLKNFSAFLLLWEALLVITLVVIFQRVVVRYLRREREVKDLTGILLLTLTHRIGNFLSVQRVNLELLERSPALDRLKESLRRLERHYRRTLDILEDLREGQGLEPVRIDLREAVERVLGSVPLREEVRVRLKLSKVHVNANPVYMEILLTSLIENALRYARTKVYIKLCRGKKNRPILVVRNDVRPHGGGSGMGLQIVKFITHKMGIEVRYRVKDHFTAVVRF